MTGRQARGSVTIATARCKGCELCIPACPPSVLVMSDAVNDAGYRYPVLHEGCTGCTACQMICPDYVFDVFRFEQAPRLPISRRWSTPAHATRWRFAMICRQRRRSDVQRAVV